MPIQKRVKALGQRYARYMSKDVRDMGAKIGEV